jgi:hypothetical protein
MPDRKQITEELENLQLEEARDSAEQRKQARAGRANKAQAIELSLRRDRAHQKRLRSACLHRKGGKGTGQMYSGNDPNFAVITHTLSHGPTIVICQRCGNVWEPPLPLTKKATPEQRVQYRADLTEYRRALNMPTDNEPSGTTLFAFTPIDDDAAA